jgi:hypothetical protein
MIERKKIEAILKGVNQSVSRLDAAMIVLHPYKKNEEASYPHFENGGYRNE